MTEQTPATEAGRRLLKWKGMDDPTNDVAALILAIEAEARADPFGPCGPAYDKGRADALREAADAVRALPPYEVATPPLALRHRHTAAVLTAAVLAILDPQP